MHGILAAFNEYRSNSDGADIRYKVGQKAKNGGTVTRTKIGYLNVRDMVGGHEIRTVAIADRVREVVASTLADEEHTARLVGARTFDENDWPSWRPRGHLLDLLADGGAVAAKVRPRLLAISEERERVKYELAEQEPLAKRARH